jgi:hypothetical protein
MTRAKTIKIDGVPVKINGEPIWFNTANSHKQATDKQLELLAIVENVDLEDLLESAITQAEVLKRLQEAFGTNVIPHEVLLKRQKWRNQRSTAPNCRICDKIGDSTRHHFVNKWILKELDQYETKWANRSQNCIPICIDCHRDLHTRNGPAHSIAKVLTPAEKDFANRALTALSEERPRLIILLGKGDSEVYESRLIKDWFEGLFEVEEIAAEVETPLAATA